MLRFLRARKLVVSDAAKMLLACVEWRQKHSPDRLTPACAAYFFQRGECVLHGEDVRGNKVGWLFPHLHVHWQGHLERYVRLLVFLAELLCVELRKTGQRATLIFDTKKLGMANIDYAFLKYITEAFANYYPETLANVLVLDSCARVPLCVLSLVQAVVLLALLEAHTTVDRPRHGCQGRLHLALPTLAICTTGRCARAVGRRGESELATATAADARHGHGHPRQAFGVAH